MLGGRALAGRECDRCHMVQLATASPPAAGGQPLADRRKHSPGSDLLQGVLGNLRMAIAELWRARPRPGRG